MDARWGVIVGLALLLAACAEAGGGLAPTPTATPVAATPVAATPVATPAPGGTAVTNPAVAAAIADLARRNSIDPARIRVDNVEAVDWPDGAIGCPQPGQSYVQVITPGYRIRLAVDAQITNYHANRAGTNVTPCPRP